MRYLDHGAESVRLQPKDGPRGFFVSELNRGLRCGRFLLLTEVPADHIQAFVVGDPDVLMSYLEQVETDCYVPLGHVALLGRPDEHHIVRHDLIFDTSYGNSSLPLLNLDPLE